MKQKFLTFIFCLMISYVFGQTAQVQPTIMVVPWSSQGEDLRTKIENDVNYRTAIQVVSNAFSSKGFTTKDFVTQLQNTLNDQVISESRFNQTDLFKQVIELSPTDYYIETEIIMLRLSSGNKVKILLNAVDKYSGAKTSAEPMSSKLFRTEDWSTLTEQALEDGGKMERFFSLLNEEFARIRENGRTISIKIEVSQGSVHSLDDEIGDDYDMLSDIIVEYVKQNAYKNYARTKGNTENLLYFNEVKIPLMKDGVNYLVDDFAKDMYKFLRRTGKKTESGELKVKKDVKGTNVLFSIQ